MPRTSSSSMYLVVCWEEGVGVRRGGGSERPPRVRQVSAREGGEGGSLRIRRCDALTPATRGGEFFPRSANSASERREGRREWGNYCAFWENVACSVMSFSPEPDASKQGGASCYFVRSALRRIRCVVVVCCSSFVVGASGHYR